LGKYQIAPVGVKTRNLAFDVTPHKYVTAIITEKGAFTPKNLKNLMKTDLNLEELRVKA
jgi:methylthioribose-1-phosphate isomerase